MVYYGTERTELITFHSEHNADDMHAILLTQHCDEAVFSVNVCCDSDWEWKFTMQSPSNYEIIKHVITELAFECEDMDELIAAMDEMFEEDFAPIAMRDECENNCCEHCGHRGCIN